MSDDGFHDQHGRYIPPLATPTAPEWASRELDRLRSELAAKDARIADQAAWAIGSVTANEELRREIRTKDARIAELELADMRRSDWKVAHIKELEGQLTERRDRVDDLDKELAEAKAALTRTQDASLWWDQYNLEVRKHADTKAALAAANASLAEAKAQLNEAEAARCDAETRLLASLNALEAANARIGELETKAEAYANDALDRAIALRARAERAEAELIISRETLHLACEQRNKAEAECKAMREALEIVIPTLEYYHKGSTALAKARAALNPSPAGPDC